MIHLLINSSCNQEAIEGGGDLFAGKSPIHNAHPSCTLFSNKPIVDTSLRSPRPNRLTLLSNGKGGPLKKKRGYGNEVWRTRDASPPPEPADLWRADRRGRSPKQVANRRLPSGSSSLGLPELKKSIYTPNLLHPTLGLTEVRVWFERRRPVLSPSMAS
jgi:hypothetical protein